MEKKKDFLIKVLFIIIIALCIVIGYIKYTDTKKEQPKDNNKQVVTNDFYKAENLIKNNYLVKVTSKDDTNIKIENGKVIVKSKYTGKDSTETIGITGTPKYVRSENTYGGGNTVYFVLTEESTLYYAELSTTGSMASNNFTYHLPKEFVKVTNQKVLNIYAFNKKTDKTYPYEYLTIYAELENKNLVQVKGTSRGYDMIDYKYQGLGKTFKENHPFMDAIMTEIGYEETIVYSNYLISWDKKLYYNNNQDQLTVENSTELKYNNKSVTIKDGFTTENDETNKVFAVGTDNYLYQVNKENTKLEKVSDKKIKDTKYTNDEENNKRYYEITYEDNTTKKYDIINVSTLNKA